jgi:hypothetical protein
VIKNLCDLLKSETETWSSRNETWSSRNEIGKAARFAKAKCGNESSLVLIVAKRKK